MTGKRKIGRRDFIKEVSAYAAAASVGIASIGQLARPIRIGIIGLGETGMNCLEMLTTIANLEVAALCDWLERPLERAQEKLGRSQASVHENATELFEQAGIDGVVLAVPKRGLNSIYERILRRRVVVYTEQPIITESLARTGRRAPVVFGRPLGVDESFRDSLEAALVGSEAVRHIDVHLEMNTHEVSAASRIPRGVFAEAIAPCLPALADPNLEVELIPSLRSTLQEPFISLALRGRRSTNVQQFIRIEIHAFQDPKRSQFVMSTCRYNLKGRTIELRCPAMNPRRLGLAMFVARCSRSGLVENPRRISEQRIAMEFEDAVFASIEGRRRMTFVAA